MGDETHGERIAVLETKITAIEKRDDLRSAREWAIILAVVGLLATTILKGLGFGP